MRWSGLRFSGFRKGWRLRGTPPRVARRNLRSAGGNPRGLLVGDDLPQALDAVLGEGGHAVLADA
jgi:hypothetical protein